MQWLITGATGFVGTHLVQYLERTQPNIRIVGTTLTLATDSAQTRYANCELRDQTAVSALLDQTRPDVIVHLAGQASIDQSFKDPWGTFQSNIQPLIYLMDTCVRLGLSPRTLVITSADIYGRVLPDELPVYENAAMRPANPYSVSKVTQDLLAQQYFMNYNLPIIRARPFNHIGIGQSEAFVVTAFAMQIARIEAGLQAPQIHVGNLQSSRDFTDVRDIVQAYVLLAERGTAGEAYNVASGQSIRIDTILTRLLALCPLSIEVVTDTARLRPGDTSAVRASCDKLEAATGWKPTILLEQTLRDVLDDCRQRVRRV